MSDVGDERGFKEPPGDFITAPVNRVTALMDSPDGVAAAVEELTQAGIDRDEIFVLSGQKGAERIDVSGRHHGLRGRIYRFVEQMGGLSEEVARAADHMAAGGLAISVPAKEEEIANNVADILEGHGGHEIIHHGRFHWDRLRP
ncbi:MAG: hypothetical protein M3164_02210 [Actinomycetota bacterium]|nr:hypothetical protein [Actinomycetota bacterium]